MSVQQEAYQQQDILDSRRATKTKGEFTFLQHNTAKQQEAQQSLLEIASSRKTDFVLLQEPRAWLDKTNKKWFTVPHPSYTLILPTTTTDKRPRVAIYIRNTCTLEYKVCTNLIANEDFLAIEVFGHTERFLLLNIYNEKELAIDSSTQTTGIRTIARALLPLQIKSLPFLLAGDFNCHHPWWNSSVSEPNREAKRLASWLQEHQCTLLNQAQEQTFFRPNLLSTSILDLAFATKFKSNTWDNWCRVEDTGSDHITISYSMFTSEAEVFLNPMQDRLYALLKADWPLFQKTLKEQTTQEKLLENIQEITQTLPLLLSTTPTILDLPDSLCRALDTIANTLTTCIQHAANIAIPLARKCERSKPWWNKELANLRKSYSKKLRKLEMAPTDKERISRTKVARNCYFHAVTKTKTNYWNSFLEKAKGKEIFTALNYTKERTVRKIPSLAYKEAGQACIAEDFSTQCKAFLTTLFPTPPTTTAPTWNNYAQNQNQWEWPELDSIEIKKAIFTTSENKAPGTDKLPNAIIRQAHLAIAETIDLFYKLLFKVGYHPSCWREAIGAILPKANKDDYTLPKAYRVISLLNSLGKVLEKIQATRLSYLAEGGQLLQSSQIGGRKQQSALDAALLLQHYVQKKHKNRSNRVTTVAFLDVKGAFDYVATNQMLSMCKKLELPFTLIRWIFYMLSTRQVQLRFNGCIQPMQPIATGIPQGSPVSPILFLIYIRDICKQRQGSFSLSYIDDYCIATTSTSEKKNCKHLDIAIKQLVKEGKESAIEFDASKTELLHISSKRQQTQESICIRGESFAPSKVVRWLGFYLDPKLSFKNHIERRISLARQALFRINRLGNTQRGLSMQANRQLYISCITTVADYGAQLWWGIRRNTLLKTYKTLQNAALKQILGAFTGSPTLAMEIEASILPVKLRIDKLCNSYAIRLLAFNKLHPIKLAIAEHTQDELATESSYNSNNSTLSRLQPTTQLETLVARIKGFKHSNKFEKISYLWAKPWDKPISAFATLAISIASKQDTAKQHTTLLHNLATQELETPLLFYTDGSKKDSQTAAGYCLLQLEEPGQKQRYTKATNLNLGEHMEIMDAELFAIYKALQSIPYAEGKQIYIFVDSQAALKRLDKVSTTGGQQCVHAIAQLCKKLQQQNNTLYFSWVPGHKDVIGNEHADKLAKAGLKRKASKEAYTSLSNLRRQLKAKTLQEWRTLWFTAKDQHKGKQYEQNTKGAPQITLKANMLSYPRKIQSAYYQLKLGKGFFKSHSKAIGKDREGKCFGNCRVLQTPRHLVLHCKHYKNERKEMEKALGSRLSLSKLFNTKRGKEAILAFLQTTQIATLPWLLQAGDLDLLVNLAPL